MKGRRLLERDAQRAPGVEKWTELGRARGAEVVPFLLRGSEVTLLSASLSEWAAGRQHPSKGPWER